jgi:hypothetical protein
MENIKIQIIIPKVRLFKNQIYPELQITNALSEIQKCIKDIKLNFNQDFIQIKFKIHKKLPLKHSKDFQSIFYLRDEEVLEFSSSLKIDYNTILFDSINEEDSLIAEFKKVIDEIFILSQISSPGAIKLRNGIIKVGENTEEYKSISSIIRDAYEIVETINYPKIDFIPLNIIYKKINQSNIRFNNNPSCTLEKALNCFTHVLNSNLEIEEVLMYAMIGLETIYVSGNNNIQNQLNTKIQIYLGELKSFKSVIKDMYSSRSKLFHGEYYLKPYHISYNNFDFNLNDEKLFNAFSFSTILLLVTIQKMIIESKKDLIFEYKLSNQKNNFPRLG